MPDTLLLSYNDSVLYKSDMQLLCEPNWLNDRLIGFWLEYTQERMFSGRDDVLFVAPEVVQLLRECSRDDLAVMGAQVLAPNVKFALLPVNNSVQKAGVFTSQPVGSHWSLLVLSQPDSLFFHFDSSNGMNRQAAQSLANRLTPKLKYKEGQALQQGNSYDCGVHVLCCAEHLAEIYLSKGNLVEGLEGSVPPLSRVEGARKRIESAITELVSRKK